MITCNRPNGETVYICNQYTFRTHGASYDAWGQRRIAGRLFDIATMTIQRDAVATGPPWATDHDLIWHAFQQIGAHP